MECDLRVVIGNKTFPLKVSFGHGVYHSNDKTSKISSEHRHLCALHGQHFRYLDALHLIVRDYMCLMSLSYTYVLKDLFIYYAYNVLPAHMHACQEEGTRSYYR